MKSVDASLLLHMRATQAPKLLAGSASALTPARPTEPAESQNVAHRPTTAYRLPVTVYRSPLQAPHAALARVLDRHAQVGKPLADLVGQGELLSHPQLAA